LLELWAKGGTGMPQRRYSTPPSSKVVLVLYLQYIMMQIFFFALDDWANKLPKNAYEKARDKNFKVDQKFSLYVTMNIDIQL
jgi:hypothetical protein